MVALDEGDSGHTDRGDKTQDEWERRGSSDCSISDSSLTLLWLRVEDSLPPDLPAGALQRRGEERSEI